ncbi:uncharacterized protein [Bemisia tabaci]|uniref:uncharacterized protein n=1 Tax=Bemisia tabaci TaxID=7038 RepID=UPI0008F9DA51|nr:PREDICTED: uncharacterized protein LOC109042346 [Bemisia tabaci]
MGRCCCVPGCKSNYASSPGPNVSTFKFPDSVKDPERHAKWINALSRDNFTVTKSSVVCIKHFHPQFVVTHEEFKTKEGPVIQVPREVPKLTKDAYPTIFPNQPAYRSTVPAKRRKDPSERDQEMARAQLKRSFQLQEERDTIRDLKHFKEGFLKRSIGTLKSESYNGYMLLSKVEDDNLESLPFIIFIKISEDLVIKVFNNFAELSYEPFKSCLGPDLKCDRWSKFESLIQMLPVRDERALKEKVTNFASKISDAVVWCEIGDDIEAEKAAKLNFLIEQLKLAVATSIRYSPEMLKWAAAIFYAFPGAYKSMRATEQLTLPHPRYLQKLLCKIGNDGCGIGPTQKAFLMEKFKLLAEEDKTVNLQLDEIYTNSKLVYKGGKVFGIAEHGSGTSSDLTAGTIQAFMSSSLQSKNKDVIALFPVRNLDGEILLQLTKAVLKLMVEVGFFVLCAISDNNQVNRKMFELLCGGVLKTRIPNPFDPSKPLFLLFDQVHLFKNIRNNWLNAPNQVLKIPDVRQVPLFDKPLHTSNPIEFDSSNCNVVRPVPNEVTFLEAKFEDVKNLYHAEANAVLKLAPKLTRKAVYPSSVERQNVSLVNAVFQDSTRVALQTLKKDNVQISDGSIMFLQIIGRWWKISNVKNPDKGKRLNDMWCEPVMGTKDQKLKFLRDLLLFLEIWELPGLPESFTVQTHTAFYHTIKATLELCEFVLIDLGWGFVLLGKLQTDNLEARFGGYRRISGCSYFVTVEQVLESERKLKLLSILKLKSANSGEFSLTSFAEGCKATATALSEKAEDTTLFESALSEISEITVTLTDRRVLLCLASYAATKTLQKLRREEKEVCAECRETLVTNKPLEIERVKETYEYLSGLDRGGLNRPSDFSFHFCMDSFKLFQTLISQKYEKQFLKLNNQRKAFKTLGVKLCEQTLDDMLFSCESDSCNLSLQKVVKKFTGVLANIFLNNYTKTLNESNITRQIAIKLQKQEAKQEAKKKAEDAKKEAEKAKQLTDEIEEDADAPTNDTESKIKYSKAKVKDVNARKIAKLSSKGSL